MSPRRSDGTVLTVPLSVSCRFRSGCFRQAAGCFPCDLHQTCHFCSMEPAMADESAVPFAVDYRLFMAAAPKNAARNEIRPRPALERGIRLAGPHCSIAGSKWADRHGSVVADRAARSSQWAVGRSAVAVNSPAPLNHSAALFSSALHRHVLAFWAAPAGAGLADGGVPLTSAGQLVCWCCPSGL